MGLHVPNIQGPLLASYRHRYVSYRDLFSAKSVAAQFFLRLYIHEFFIRFFKACNIENRQYELYISMASVMQLFIFIEIQQFKVKFKNIFNRFNKARERQDFNSDNAFYDAS